MSDLKSVSLASISQVEIFQHWSKELINEHLNLGWRLLETNNVTEREQNPETGEYDTISSTLFILGWPSELGEIRIPEVKENSYESFEPVF